MNYLIIFALFAPIVAFAETETPKDQPKEQPPIALQQSVELIQKNSQVFNEGDEVITVKAGDLELNVEGTEISNRYQRNAPSAFAPNVYPSNPCAIGWSLAASWLKGSGGIGKAKIDPECNEREWIRTAPETHKLYLFCKAEHIETKFDSFKECMDHNAPTKPTPPNTYDDAAIKQQLESHETAISDVRAELQQTQTEVLESQQFVVTASKEDPYAAMHERVQAQTEYIE